MSSILFKSINGKSDYLFECLKYKDGTTMSVATFQEKVQGILTEKSTATLANEDGSFLVMTKALIENSIIIFTP